LVVVIFDNGSSTLQHGELATTLKWIAQAPRPLGNRRFRLGRQRGRRRAKAALHTASGNAAIKTDHNQGP
jgi:hypothetical protein